MLFACGLFVAFVASCFVLTSVEEGRLPLLSTLFLAAGLGAFFIGLRKIQISWREDLSVEVSLRSIIGKLLWSVLGIPAIVFAVLFLLMGLTWAHESAWANLAAGVAGIVLVYLGIQLIRLGIRIATKHMRLLEEAFRENDLLAFEKVLRELREANIVDVEISEFLPKAAKEGRIEWIDPLLAAGVPVDSGSALQDAVAAQQAGTIKMLLERGANPLARRGCVLEDLHLGSSIPPPQNAFDEAIENAPIEIVELLLDHVVDLNEPVGDLGMPALCVVAYRTRPDGTRFSFSDSPDLAHRLENTADRSFDLAQLFLRYGADPNVVGGGPLRLAVQNGDSRFAAILLENGADVNAASSSGWAPLHFAARYGLFHVAQTLLRNGADVDLPGGPYGETPLQVAAGSLDIETGLFYSRLTLRGKTYTGKEARDQGYVETCRLLVEHGAKVKHDMVYQAGRISSLAAFLRSEESKQLNEAK